MVNDKVKRAKHLFGAVERRNERIAKLTKEQEDDLAELHAPALDLVQTHGPGAGVTPDVMAAVVAPKDPKPDNQ